MSEARKAKQYYPGLLLYKIFYEIKKSVKFQEIFRTMFLLSAQISTIKLHKVKTTKRNT